MKAMTNLLLGEGSEFPMQSWHFIKIESSCESVWIVMVWPGLLAYLQYLEGAERVGRSCQVIFKRLIAINLICLVYHTIFLAGLLGLEDFNVTN